MLAAVGVLDISPGFYDETILLLLGVFRYELVVMYWEDVVCLSIEDLGSLDVEWDLLGTLGLSSKPGLLGTIPDVWEVSLKELVFGSPFYV